MKKLVPLTGYIVVGSIAFIVDYGVTYGLLSVLPLLLANSLGFITANVVNFLLAHSLVFQRRFEGAALFQIYVSTLLVSVIGLFLNSLLVWIGVVVLGLSLLLTKALAALIVLVWNYCARVLWIYRQTH